MSVKFKVVERKIKFAGKEETIYVARPEPIKTTSFDDVVGQIVLQTSLGPGDVLSVLRTLGDVVGHELKEGRAVSLDYLGTISPSYRCRASRKEEEITRVALYPPKANFRAKPYLKQWLDKTVMEVENLKAKPNCPDPGAHKPAGSGDEGDPSSTPGA